MKFFLVLFMVAIGFALSCISEASSSRTITNFFTQPLTQLLKSEDAMLRAPRGDVEESQATIETSPTVLQDSMAKILLVNDMVISGGTSKEVAGSLIQVGGKGSY